MRQGKDPQLDKAIEIVMDGLAKNPPQKPTRPVYPDYHKKWGGHGREEKVIEPISA